MKTLLKDTLKEIKNSFGRFMSILLIIALGVGFFAGIKATGPDMKNTGDKYFRDNGLMDFWLISTMGFTEEDLKSFEKIPGIEDYMGAYSKDALLKIGDKDSVIKLMSFREEDQINRPILVEGRLPEKSGECVLEASDNLRKNFKLGSKISLSSGLERDLLEDLEHSEYKIVGYVNSPLHISYERGSTSIGNGKLSSFMLIGADDFKSDYYSDLYLKIGEDLHSFSDQYKDKLEDLAKDIEELGEERRKLRYEDIKSELLDKEKEGRDKLEEERLKGQKELDSAQLTIDQGWKDLKEGEKKLERARKDLDNQLGQASSRLDQEEASLDQAYLKYNQGLKDFEGKKEEGLREIEAGEVKLGQAEEGLRELKENIALLEKQLEEVATEEEAQALEEEIKTLKAMEEGLKGDIEKARKEVDLAKKQLKEGEEELKTQGHRLDQGAREIKSSRERLKSERLKGEERLASESKKLESAKKELRQGELDHKEGQAKLDSELDKAERQLKKLRKEINKLEKPSWFIVKRNNMRDYIEFEMGADRIDSVAQVFPLFFLLIALLVCLTTMTRMVDEQRAYIGTLKALGYGRFSIMSKYLIYGLLASILGSILGLVVGFQVLPNVIFNAYRIMFIMPEVLIEFNKDFALISTVAAVITSLLAVFLAVNSEVKETPALLMRPKAPKAGKRILLERIGPVWKRMNFSRKVTARNIFRYKRRLFMTVIGIAGCTALLLAGFGLMDSIMDITVNQYDLISKYDMTIDINDGIIDREKDPVIEFLKEDKRIDSYILTGHKNVEIIKDGEKKDLELIVVEDGVDLSQFIDLKNRESGQAIDFDKDSLILTEKMGKLLNLKKGDELKLDLDGKEGSFKLKDLTENYAFHYAYIKESYYKEIFKEELDYNRILVKNLGDSEDFEDKLSKDLLDLEDVSSLLFIRGLSKSLNDTMDSLNNVIAVIIVAAGALAFIVLYNLTNINIGERKRELATIKVLGFYDKELSRYVYRENNILTLLGIFLGIFLGLLLHKFVIHTVEIDMIMFGRRVRPISLLYSAILTMAFSLLVNFVMHFRLKKIDMVESMKSVD